MTDIFSREETELAVFGWVRQSFKRTFIPHEISKVIQKFWDDTNYFILQGTAFDGFLSKTRTCNYVSFSHIQQVYAAYKLASFKLALTHSVNQKVHALLPFNTRWSLQMTDNKTDKNGFFPICLIYFEIFCEDINYYYKNILFFDSKNDTKTWTGTSLGLSKVTELPKYKHNKDKEKQLTFGVFIQLLSKKYRTKPYNEDRCIYLRDPNARFNDYHKKIVMKNHVKYKWIYNFRKSPKENCVFSPSFDHGNWCLKYVNGSNQQLYLKLLRVHGLLEKIIVECVYTIVTNKGNKFRETKNITMNCEDLKWVQLGQNYKDPEFMVKCWIEIKILKAFKMTENEIGMIDERYWYVYGIQIKKTEKKKKIKIDNKKKVNVRKRSNVKRVKFKAIVVKKVRAKKAKTILKTEEGEKENEEEIDKPSSKRVSSWRFRKREKIKYIDKKGRKSPK